MKPTRERKAGRGRRSGGKEGRGRRRESAPLRRRLRGVGAEVVGLEGGKGRVGREGSGGGARCAASLPVLLVRARGGADSSLIGIARTFLTGLCLMGGRGEDWVPKPAAAQHPENWRDERIRSRREERKTGRKGICCEAGFLRPAPVAGGAET